MNEEKKEIFFSKILKKERKRKWGKSKKENVSP